MLIDASIPLGVRPPQFDSPLETYGKVEQLNALRAQGQLRDMQMQEFQDKRSRDQARRQIMAQGLRGEALAAALEQGGYLDDASGIRKQMSESEKSRLELAAKKLELRNQLLQGVLADPQEKTFVSAARQYETISGERLPDEFYASIYELRNDPEQIKRVAAGLVMKPEQLLPKTDTRDIGGQVIDRIVDPITGLVTQTDAIDKTVTPDAVMTDKRTREEGEANRRLTRRGQDLANERAREKNKNDADAVGKVEWKQGVDGEWVALPKEVRGPGPVTPITTTVPGKRESQAKNALGIIKEAKTLIDKGTSSYIGAGVDQVARAFGKSTEGADAAAQLKALEGALMMAQPRMEGPQSDKDVALYRQMAAQLGDPTIPASQKRLALEVVERLHKRYAPEEAPKTVQTDSLPDPAQYPGAVMRDDQTGMRYQSDGKSWRRL